MKILKQIAVAALGTMMLVSGAHAAPFTAGSYYEENAFAQCNSAFCRAIFSPVPAGQTLLVTGVSCRINVINGALFLVQLSLGFGNVREEFLQFGPATPSGTSNRYTVHDEVKFYYTPGQRPSVSAFSTTGGTNVLAACRIVGTRPAPV